MPEMAEVETVRRTLKDRLLNRTIKSIDIIYPKIIEGDINEFKNILSNKIILDINRIGKWLIFNFGDYSLLSHLRMEGKYFIKSSDDEILKHEHIIFHLDNNCDLRYHDTRKFGRMILTKTEEIPNIKEIKKLGIEPSDNLSVSYLKDKLNRKIPIKSLLLDQTIINGLGNIYADEVLFASKINPTRLGSSITDKEVNRIIESAKTIILRAIEMGGTTIRSYTSSLGVTGNYQNELKVHKKENIPCSICNTNIIKITVGGRSTYYCPKCQK